MPPVAERQRHRLVHLPFRNWCTFDVIGREREESHKKREKKEVMTPRVWLDHATCREPAEDMLVVLALGEEESGAIEAAGVTEKGGPLKHQSRSSSSVWGHGV